ncbi:MAG: heavy metal translocating P-type ATPase [Candidatus Marinarcus sp.]|uniref:heavy metal translocating P-type ATPase n=1 Tax=Candidatus Marinarcus sp. TaxID=3100987 RepID=UPI003AFFAF2C
MSTIKCNHCHVEFSKDVMIKENDLYFCCNGCQGVYHLLKDGGLDSFYEKLGNKTIAPPLQTDFDTSKFDLESFEKRFVQTLDNGLKKVDLIIEGIHCAACVWLNEKVLYDTKGIVEANINFTNNKAKIVWNEEQVSLSEIINKIRSIGYNAYAYDSKIADEKATQAKRDYFIRMMVAVFATMNIMMLSVAKYTGFFRGIDDDVMDLIHIGEFILTTPVLFYSGWIFFKGAYFGLKNRIVNMDLLVSAGASLSYIYSIYVMLGGHGESYFDSVTMIITFVLVGKYLEVIGKKSAVDTLDKIKSQLPLEAVIIKENQKTVVALDEIEVGDIIELRAGEKACVDGELLIGTASFDESSISGESKFIYKNIGDKIFSGTINTDSLIQYRASTTFANSTLNSIVTLLEDSLSSKPQIEYTANELSKKFSLTILTLSLLTFCVWYFFGLQFGFVHEGANHFEQAFIVAISVIVIACPCALALATPIASLVGISQLANKGLLFKEAKFIETLARATKVVVDKTGTITNGELSVKKARILDDNIHKLNLLYSILEASNHPISLSVKAYLKNKYPELVYKDITEVKHINARGVVGKYTNVEGKTFEILGGNQELLHENGIHYKFDSQCSVYMFAINKRVIATFELEDSLKEDAKAFVEYIQNQNIEIIMLTGDNKEVAQKIAKQVGIKKFVAHINPIEKANYIKKLKDEGEIVIMAGDGINDAVALSNCDVAVAMGSGADISISVSDVVLLNNSLKSLKDAFVISKRTYKFIKQNLAISLVYNIITIPLAMFGFVIPLVAALSMSLSSLIVVANSMRIKNN